MARKTPIGVSYLESLKIAFWFERLRDNLGKDHPNPSGITSSQIMSWLRFNRYEFDIEKKTWFRSEPNPKPKPKPPTDCTEE